MNKNLGRFAGRVRLILQACFPQIKPDAIEDVVDRIDIAAKDSAEIREHWKAESKGLLND